jgi:RNA-directed DNA polymerase
MSTVRPEPMYGWDTIRWKHIERTVFKLQKRIYRAQNRGEAKTVRTLQRLLMTSWSAKLLAVRRVTQDNRGKNTAGVDGIKSLTPTQSSPWLVNSVSLQRPPRCVRYGFPNPAPRRHDL